MLNISGINEGYVLDHIKAGRSMSIYKDLKLEQLDCPVAIIKNAKSSKMGKKISFKCSHVDSFTGKNSPATGFSLLQPYTK